MMNRMPLAPNNRRRLALSQLLVSGVTSAKFPKAVEEASVFNYARSGRQGQANGANGGGYRVGR